MPLPVPLLAASLLLGPVMGDNALSSLHSQGPKRLEITYKGIVPVPVLGRIEAASAVLSADISATSYVIRTRAKASGMVDWFVNHNLFLTATGSVTPKGLAPARYVSTNQDGKKNRQVTVDFTGGDVITTAVPHFGDLGSPAATPEQKLQAMDPLSAIVHLTLHVDATPANPCGGPLRAFDGKQRYDLVLSYAGRIQYKSKAYKGPALKCDVTYVELAGFKAKSDKQKAKDAKDIEWTNIILAELDGGAVTAPIKIEMRSKKRGKMTVEATRVSWGPAPVDELK
jgi:hypothetical protein